MYGTRIIDIGFDAFTGQVIAKFGTPRCSYRVVGETLGHITQSNRKSDTFYPLQPFIIGFSDFRETIENKVNILQPDPENRGL